MPLTACEEKSAWGAVWQGGGGHWQIQKYPLYVRNFMEMSTSWRQINGDHKKNYIWLFEPSLWYFPQYNDLIRPARVWCLHVNTHGCWHNSMSTFSKSTKLLNNVVNVCFQKWPRHHHKMTQNTLWRVLSLFMYQYFEPAVLQNTWKVLHNLIGLSSWSIFAFNVTPQMALYLWRGMESCTCYLAVCYVDVQTCFPVL